MANEITALEVKGNGDVQVLFYYPIPAGIRVQVGGANVVPTASVGLPLVAKQVLTTIEKQALDAGESMFHIVQINTEGTAAETLARLRARYADMLEKFRAEYVRRYGFIGQRFDAT